MKKFIYIEGDTNDADYISKLSEIDDEDLEIIKPIIEKIKTKSGHNWANSYAREGDELEDLYPEFFIENVEEEYFEPMKSMETFERYVPRGENGIHTIVTIQLLTVESIEDLF